jgi:hypothetical protein
MAEAAGDGGLAGAHHAQRVRDGVRGRQRREPLVERCFVAQPDQHDRPHARCALLGALTRSRVAVDPLALFFGGAGVERDECKVARPEDVAGEGRLHRVHMEAEVALAQDDGLRGAARHLDVHRHASVFAEASLCSRQLQIGHRRRRRGHFALNERHIRRDGRHHRC